MRALACALIVLPAAAFGAAASTNPQRESPVDECVQAAVAQMGRELTQRIAGSVRVRGDAQETRVVYLDLASDRERLPVRMRLYCSVNENGEIEHVLSTPRLMRAG
mgnify:FL=1|jgi:hypothetical protein